MAGLVTLIGWVTVLVTPVLGAGFLTGHWRLTHSADRLPAVMFNRYVGLGVLGLAIVLDGSRALLAVFFATASGLALWDALIYRGRGDVVVWPHWAVAVFGAVLAALALLT